MNPEEEKTIPVQAADAELHQSTPGSATDQSGTPDSTMQDSSQSLNAAGDTGMNTGYSAGTDQVNALNNNAPAYPQNQGVPYNNAQGYPQNPGTPSNNAQGYPQNPGTPSNNAQGYPQNPGTPSNNAQGYPQYPNGQYGSGINQNGGQYGSAQSFAQGFQNMTGGTGMNTGYGAGTNQTNAQFNNAQGYPQNPNAQFGAGMNQNNGQYSGAQGYQNPNAQLHNAQGYPQNPNAQFGAGMNQNNGQYNGAQGCQNPNAQFHNTQGYQNPYYVNSASVPGAAPVKKKSKKKIWIPIVSVALVAAIAVGIYFLVSKKTRNPEEAVTTAMSNTFSAERTSAVTGWLHSQELDTLAQNGAYQLDMDMTFTEISGSLAEDISQLEGFGISTTMQLDKDAERLASGAGILYDGTTYLEYEVYAYDDYMALACPSLFEGYIEFKTSNFGEDFNNSILAEALDTQIDPSLAFRFFELFDTVQKTETEIPREIQEFIDAVRYEEGDKKDLQVNGKTQTCQGYNIVITRESMEQLARWFCDYATTLGTPIEYDEIAPAIPNKDFVMTVYVDNKGRMARFSFDFSLGMTDSLSCQIDFTGLGDNPADHITGELKMIIEGYSYGFQFESATDTAGTVETQKTTMSIDVSGISIANADYTSTFDSDSQSGHVDLSVSAMYTSLLSMNMDYSYSDVVPGERFTVNMEDLTLDVAGELTIGLSGSSTVSRLNGPVSEPSGTKYDLFTLTEEDVLSLGEEILDNVSNGPLSFLLVELYNDYDFNNNDLYGNDWDDDWY